ncbi:hypothetical protein MNAB215_5849 [Mycobacterium numidiamassiliense]|uniref:Peptidase M41 domain-containing protein n=2 Tax=Mycobacterium numidiamassiliense TaxID=1841861 RepID=A0A2U3PIN7_9MYCO|nr:hypothetical protein MNAB215_5849 [Mycobacterium numidiamassiliense]
MPTRDEEAAEARRITAYHEAGHARAAVRRGGTVHQIDITTDDLNGIYDGNTHADIDDVHLGFHAYSGPWVSARYLHAPEESVDIDRVMPFVRYSQADWPMLQKALGRTDVTEDVAFDAYTRHQFDRDPEPGEVRPDAETANSWHQEYEDEWSQIEDLAERLLAGQMEIQVGDSVLVRVGESDCWRRPDYAPPPDD